jgi:hypothetical protein
LVVRGGGRPRRSEFVRVRRPWESRRLDERCASRRRATSARCPTGGGGVSPSVSTNWSPQAPTEGPLVDPGGDEVSATGRGMPAGRAARSTSAAG